MCDVRVRVRVCLVLPQISELKLVSNYVCPRFLMDEVLCFNGLAGTVSRSETIEVYLFTTRQFT